MLRPKNYKPKPELYGPFLKITNMHNLNEAFERCREIKAAYEKNEIDTQFGIPVTSSLMISLNINYKDAIEIFEEAKTKGDKVKLPYCGYIEYKENHD